MALSDSPPMLPTGSEPLPVPEVSEAEMWAAELAYLPVDDAPLRQAQFAIRTAVRAQELANAAGTSAVDELLDARAVAKNSAAQHIYETAINYLAREQELRLSCVWPN